jgi:hypothetical protein
MTPEIIAELIKDLESPNPGRVYGAAKILAELGSSDAIDLIPYLKKATIAFLDSEAKDYILAVVQAALNKLGATKEHWEVATSV